MSAWTARVATLFPDMFPGPLELSLAGRALQRELWRLEVADIRDYAHDKHRTVDDTPFGGGAGMVMRPDIVDACLTDIHEPGTPLIYLSPKGALFDQTMARELAAGPGMTLLCGRYEGVDQRVLDAHGATEVSVGDYVLMGGELPALTMIECCIRLLDGVIGKQESLEDESIETGLLEYPHYTRPASWAGRDVPDVLLSGHHGNVASWRLTQAQDITRQRRPDLWARHLEGLEKAEEELR